MHDVGLAQFHHLRIFVFIVIPALRVQGAVPGLRATIQLLPTDVEAHLGDEPDLI